MVGGVGDAPPGHDAHLAAFVIYRCLLGLVVLVALAF